MKPCILLIEDDGDMRELVAGYLEHSGFDVQKAEDGIKGQALALQYSPDLIVLDLMLPRVDGLTLCQRLRRDDRTALCVSVEVGGRLRGRARIRPPEPPAPSALGTPHRRHPALRSLDLLLAPGRTRIRPVVEIPSDAPFGCADGRHHRQPFPPRGNSPVVGASSRVDPAAGDPLRRGGDLRDPVAGGGADAARQRDASGFRRSLDAWGAGHPVDAQDPPLTLATGDRLQLLFVSQPLGSPVPDLPTAVRPGEHPTGTRRLRRHRPPEPARPLANPLRRPNPPTPLLALRQSGPECPSNGMGHQSGVQRKHSNPTLTAAQGFLLLQFSTQI